PKYGGGDYNYGVVEWKIPSDATVAIIGDIGTGTDVAAAVLLSALSFNPDVILHVGDVYYSGTRQEFKNYFVGLIQAVYKDQGVKVPMYTLPGNHEYFTGAIPYFECLDSNDLIFEDSQKQQASFFKLETEDGGWQFLGMDTSYHGHYMGGPQSKLDQALKDLHLNPDNAFNPVVPPDMVYVRPDEVDWHHYHLNQHKGRTILFGHHQLYSANQKVGIPQKMKDGKPDPLDYNRPGVNTRLWQAFGAYFHKVAAWYWGHEHNLCIYEDNFRPEGWPEASDAPDGQFKTLVKGRCVGHSAIPVAEAEEPYKINNPIPFVRDDLKLDLYNGWYNRGFEILKLNGSGNPSEVAYYQVKGADPTPIKIYQETIQ
ncbi:MAG: metallophosphoesterase, partial [Saprospiraceae bacterium]|nr:metallophosphoesterase [Saprospiraceae bacterium]